MIERIGILGGGQLGRMLTLEAKRMGYTVVTLDPLPHSPTGQVADEQIVAAYDDERAVGELGARTDVVTYEFENIAVTSIEQLEQSRRMVRPNSRVLAITQDRLREKRFVRDCGIMTTEFAPVRDRPELLDALARIGFPLVLKTVFGGYDGKGQWLVRDANQAEAAFAEAKGAALVAEAFVPFDKELSIIVVRSARDEIVTFPVAENRHDRGVLATSIVPARIPREVAAAVESSAVRIARALEIVGAFCIEYFLAGETLFVNEIAPRVHNSGHYSLDATQISQFEAHVRAICDLPLVQPRLLVPAVVMVNILGTGEGDHLAGIEDVLADPDLALHLYGKMHAAAGRKMGHFTVLGDTADDALASAERAREQLRWVDQRTLAP
jgi:5-(carboxyamino)imidazole ribonucleotide synthase